MKPTILRDIPDQFETERLLVRVPRAGDGNIIRPAVLASQEHLRPWLPWSVDLSDDTEQEAFARRGRVNFLQRTEWPYLIFRRADGVFLGGTGVHAIIWTVPKFELGYWLQETHTGHGYMTEAVNGLTNFLFSQLNAERVEIRCDADNTASAAVARRCGYTQEARFRHARRHHQTNQLIDMLVFAKLRPNT